MAATTAGVVVVTGLAWALARTIATAGGGYDTIFLLLGVLALIGVVGTVALIVGIFRRRNGAFVLLAVSIATAVVLGVFGLAVGLRG